jgi:hypothetical protein
MYAILTWIMSVREVAMSIDGTVQYSMTQGIGKYLEVGI